MPYKNKQIEKMYKIEWEERNKENRIWDGYLWHKQNQEYKNELDRKSYAKHKDYYNWLNKFKRILKSMENDE